MNDPGKVIVALGFFASLVYIVRLLVLGGTSFLRRNDVAPAGLVLGEERMARLEQAVEAIALEVERISEGQRFTTKLLAERGQADRVEAPPSIDRRHVTPH